MEEFLTSTEPMRVKVTKLADRYIKNHNSLILEQNSLPVSTRIKRLNDSSENLKDQVTRIPTTSKIKSELFFRQLKPYNSGALSLLKDKQELHTSLATTGGLVPQQGV
jgi:hypothetical protein